jgi:hypothetical protein
VGWYEQTARGSAVVAFVLEDGLLGLGLGRELLHHLAYHARRNGIDEFTALVLNENTDMIGLLRHSRYPYQVSSEAETVTLRLRIGAEQAASLP